MAPIFSLFFQLTLVSNLAFGAVIPFRRLEIFENDPLEPRQLEAIGVSGVLPTINFEPTGFAITIKVRPTTTTKVNPASTLTLVLGTTTISTIPLTTSVASTTSVETTSLSTSTTATPSTSATSQTTAVPSTTPAKLVVAHHMIGNTFPYTKEDWLEDVKLAHDSGIDGFALNTGKEVWEPEKIADAYQAAQEAGDGFKLFISLDMASLPCNSAEDAAYLRKLVLAHANHPNQLKHDGKAFVSTFAGENCQFGQGSTVDGWKSQFSKHPELDGKIYFVPSFFMDPAKFGDFSEVMNGDFNWNSGWPIQVTTSFAKEELSKLTGALDNAQRETGSSSDRVISVGNNRLQTAVSKFIGATDSDVKHLEALNVLQGKLGKRDGNNDKPVYMAAVSPWFFTHYGEDSFNKNFIFLSDQHLYAKRWESLVESRDQYDIIQILTWNDYGESHYIGPIKGDQPNSEAWTDGMPHTAWLELTKYYSAAFKAGEYPTIEKDKIVMWSRPHSTQAQSPDSIPQPDNFELMEDAVWAVVLTTAPSTVTLSTSVTTSKTFEVPAGVSKLSLPITPGGTLSATIKRNGATVVELKPTPEEFTFQGSPKSYNFNAFVASATAP